MIDLQHRRRLLSGFGDASYITGSILNVDDGLTSNFGPSCVSKSDLTGNRYVMTIARS